MSQGAFGFKTKACDY
ncbi:hypothetical protein CP99DC5_1157A, partial [Chlamydia psittaci 99DC5]